MKKVLLNIYRGIVGNEFGWSGEGNEQWYYFLALVMNCMLTWWLKPELGIIFTAFSVVHFIMTIVYANFFIDPEESYFTSSIIYFAIHLVMFVVCMVLNWWWTLITSAIVTTAFYIAPDCLGNNIFMRPPEPDFSRGYGVYFGNENEEGILLFHTIWFAIFVTITLLLPISIWIRLAIIVVCMILHPFIDMLEGECINVVEITKDAFYNIVKRFKNSMADEKNIDS